MGTAINFLISPFLGYKLFDKLPLDMKLSRKTILVCVLQRFWKKQRLYVLDADVS